MEEIYNYLYDKFINNDVIVVGVSAGPDSMCLLHILLKIRDTKNLNIIVCHVNHNTGRIGQKEEEKYITDYCDKNKIKIEKLKIDNYNDENFQNEARNIRYNFFEKIINKYKSSYLLTAHHGDDLIETILMRIVRGSTLKGYAGFSKEINIGNYEIIKPLINVEKKLIEEYNKENDIKYYIDASNAKDEYTRNRYRKYILPFLKKEDSSVHLKFYKYSEIILESDEFINKYVFNVINKIYNKYLNITLFKKEETLIQKRIINYIFESIYGLDLGLINDSHTRLVIDLICSDKVNARIFLPNNIVAIKEYDKLLFEEKKQIVDGYEIEISDYVILPNGKKIIKTIENNDNSNFVCRLNSNDIKLPLIVRNRKDGDKINVKGMSGSKKTKDIFIDSKITLKERENWPIVLDSNGVILWIPGLKKSKFDKQKEEFYDIILKYC